MSEPPKREERDLNEFWWKIGSVAIAVMVWFIITTVAGLSYTNLGRDGKQPAPKQPTTNALAHASARTCNGTSDLYIRGRAGVFCARLTRRRERGLRIANERATTTLRRAQKPGHCAVWPKRPCYGVAWLGHRMAMTRRHAPCITTFWDSNATVDE